MANAAVVLDGYTDLKRAFALADREIKRDLNGRLKEVAEPVRADAEALAIGRISNIGVPWSRMRVGVTSRDVYVAPRQRGVKGTGRQRRRRPNLANLLMDDAMLPALATNAPRIVAGVDDLLENIGRDWARV